MTDTNNEAPHTKPFLQDLTRLPFAFGLVAGIAVISTAAFVFTLTKVGGSSTKTTTVAAANTNTGGAAAGAPAGPVTLPTITSDDHITGSKNAKVTFIEFSDLQCPFCNQFHPTVKRILDENKDKIRLVYKHFPLDSIHPNARPAALAAECAGEQGKFFEFIDIMFTNQTLESTDFYIATAKTLKLKEAQFKTCLDTQKFASRVDSDAAQGSAAGVNGTPSSFVNGTPINGALPYEQVKAIVDAAIAAA